MKKVHIFSQALLSILMGCTISLSAMHGEAMDAGFTLGTIKNEYPEEITLTYQKPHSLYKEIKVGPGETRIFNDKLTPRWRVGFKIPGHRSYKIELDNETPPMQIRWFEEAPHEVEIGGKMHPTYKPANEKFIPFAPRVNVMISETGEVKFSKE